MTACDSHVKEEFRRVSLEVSVTVAQPVLGGPASHLDKHFNKMILFNFSFYQFSKSGLGKSLEIFSQNQELFTSNIDTHEICFIIFLKRFLSHSFLVRDVLCLPQSSG